VRGQYLFGSGPVDMTVIIPQGLTLRLVRARGWLLPGSYVGVLNGPVYDGDGELWIGGPLGGYPVFVREGSIVLLDATAEPGNGRGFRSSYHCGCR
jgi:alpha-glucosidase (family GH31 glycosyl hydrolase)